MLTTTLNKKKVRLYVTWSLAFCFLCISCADTKKEDVSVSIHWKDNHAESIAIPLSLLSGIPKDSLREALHIQVANNNTPVLGDLSMTDDAIRFQPLIPFTRGLKYEVRLSGRLVTGFEIPQDDKREVPEVVSIYPSAGVLPSNLLKMYIVFSKPMHEGLALNNITIVRDRKDTIPSIFLDLDQELWNKERTTLTIWLDPGRIKRDLQPNEKMGSPLQQGVPYRVLINNKWRDAEGASLGSTYQKEFYVGSRDSLSPDPERWTIDVPVAGSTQTLKIDLHESLDYVLLKNAISIIDARGSIVKGTLNPEAQETLLSFTPSVSWIAGEYTIEIESRLEDLAGNNLNRLFDTDLTKQRTGRQKEIYKRSFRIQ